MNIRRSALCLSVLAALGTCEAPSLSTPLFRASSGILSPAPRADEPKVMRRCRPKADNGWGEQESTVPWSPGPVLGEGLTFVGQQDPSDEDCVPPWLYEVDPEQFLELLESGCPICQEEHSRNGRLGEASGSSTTP